MLQGVIHYFNLLKEYKRLGHAYLFLGRIDFGVEKIISNISCRKLENNACGVCWDCINILKFTHPDLCIVEASGQTIKIEQIRQAQGFLTTRPFSLPQKILYLKNAALLTDEAANAFLKTLEEPPKHVVIMLSSLTQEGLLPTVISRCRKILLSGADADFQETLLPFIKSFFQGEKVSFKEREKFGMFVWSLIVIFRDALIKLIDTGKNRLIKKSCYEIILPSYAQEDLSVILETLLDIYGVHNTVNQNLALQRIKALL